MTGTVYTVAPIPPDPEHTTLVPAGVLSFGVEYRLLDDAELAANYTGQDMEEIQAHTEGQLVQDNGVSIHVMGRQDNHEYLRFDMFEQDPHYHYIEPSGEKQTIVQYDRVAMGEMLPWTLNQIRTRLPEMLSFAGGSHLIEELDAQRIDAALQQVQKLALEAQATLDAQRRGH